MAHSKSLPTVSPRYLLEGTIYALEQAGHLLRAAVLLYNSGEHASAVVLAQFGREELGRSNILCDLRKDIVERGKVVTLENVRRACEQHVVKQEKGQFGVTMRFEGGDALAKYVRAMVHSHPQSTEWREARKQIDDLQNRLAKRGPQDRHRQREAALYVEPNDAGTGWNRPREIQQEEARRCVEDFANAYGLARHHVDPSIYSSRDPDFFQALQAWPERPELPAPQWPHMNMGEPE